MTEIGKNMDIDSADVISTAKARGNNFYPESNDTQVSTANRRREDRGQK